MRLTVSPSRYGRSYVLCKNSATDVLPHPAGPVITQMCLCCDEGLSFVLEVVVELELIFARSVAGSEGGVGGKFCWWWRVSVCSDMIVDSEVSRVL